MNRQQFEREIEEVIIQLLDDGRKSDRIIFTIGKNAMEFAQRGDIETAALVWRYASRLNALGKAQFERRLRDGNLFTEGTK